MHTMIVPYARMPDVPTATTMSALLAWLALSLRGMTRIPACVYPDFIMTKI